MFENSDLTIFIENVQDIVLESLKSCVGHPQQRHVGTVGTPVNCGLG